MSRLYLSPLPNADAQTSDEGIRAAIQSAGLIEEGGVDTQKIAVDDIDLTVEGQYRLGKLFARKLTDELESLSESAYEGVAYYAPDADNSGRNRGFYDVESVDVSPAHTISDGDSTFEYTIALKSKETRETAWRAVETAPETVSTGLATGSGGLVGIPATARKVKWFDIGDGREAATVQDTVSAEFGDVALYDPTGPSFTAPTLLYETDYGAQSPVDVRVWDDRGREKYFSVSAGGAWGDGTWGSGVWAGDAVTATQWTHVFHSAFEFDGRPIIDNGLLRVTFDESAGTIPTETWDDANSTWQSVSYDLGDYDLIDADLERLGPTQVDVFAEFEDTTDGSIVTAILSIQRGIDGVIVRDPENGDVPAALETELSPIASDQTTDPQPAQTLKSRGAVK